MGTKIRVTAFQSILHGHFVTYGDGELLEDKIPNVTPFKELKRTNPCIKLDTGKYVWGFMCWWGDVDKVREKYKDLIKSTEVIEPEQNILPL